MQIFSSFFPSTSIAFSKSDKKNVKLFYISCLW